MTTPALRSLPDPPSPPPPHVRRFGPDGAPTPEQAAYEARLAAWLRALLGALKG